MIAVARSRLSPWLASDMAPPNVGPTQGLHTAPSNMPPRNCPVSDPRSTSSNPLSARAAKPAVAVENTAEAWGTSSTIPKRIIKTAPACAISSAFNPTARPKAETATPRTTKDRLIPAANATGPQRLACKAVANTIGNTGKTQGLISVSNPAPYANTKSMTAAYGET